MPSQKSSTDCKSPRDRNKPECSKYCQDEVANGDLEVELVDGGFHDNYGIFTALNVIRSEHPEFKTHPELAFEKLSATERPLLLLIDSKPSIPMPFQTKCWMPETLESLVESGIAAAGMGMSARTAAFDRQHQWLARSVGADAVYLGFTTLSDYRQGHDQALVKDLKGLEAYAVDEKNAGCDTVACTGPDCTHRTCTGEDYMHLGGGYATTYKFEASGFYEGLLDLGRLAVRLQACRLQTLGFEWQGSSAISFDCCGDKPCPAPSSTANPATGAMSEDEQEAHAP